MKLVIEEVPVPDNKKVGATKKGSKYLDEDIKEAAAALGAQPQSFHVPALTGVKQSRHAGAARFYLNEYGKTLDPVRSFVVKPENNADGTENGIRVWLKG